MNNPHFIEFEFPDKNKKQIFISNLNQLIFLLKKYKDYEKFFYKKGSDIPIKDIIPENNIPYKKIVIKIKIPNIEEYEFSNKKVDISNIHAKDLSLNYNEYFENYEYIDNNKPFFELSKEREEFFKFLKEELKGNNIIGLCGPEGIGKTASILAFCKTNYLTGYFYFNIKAIVKHLDDISKILEIISNEFTHCLEETYISKYIDLLNKNFSSFKSPLDILIYIIKNYEMFVPDIIVIDQYKTNYDENYNKLKEIFLLQKKYFHRIIFISSINEDDVKSSIISSLKGEISIIKYIYISKLIEVTAEDRMKLEQLELDLLDGFGNYYFIYYLIKKEKLNYEKIDHKGITFEDYFISKMDDYYKKGLEKYFATSDKDKLIDKIRFLFLETGKNIELQKFIDNSENIPFRFFKIGYNNNIFFKLSDLSKESNIFLEYQSNYIIICLFNYYRTFINEKKRLITSNFEKNLDSIQLEDSISLYLWAMRKKSPIKDLEIYDYITIDSIFEPKEKDWELLESKIKEIKDKKIKNLGLLIHNFSQNAVYFDTCIIKLIDKNKFEFYFFQSTIKKDASERFTLIFLNENLSYIISLYQLKLSITVDKFYYYYIFDEKSPDIQTMKECSNNFIDYLKFNPTTYLFSSKKNFNLYQYKTKIKLFLDSNSKLTREDSILEINKMSINDLSENQKEEKLKITHDFLKKKRKLISENKKPDDYLAILNEHENYYKSITKNEKYEMTLDEKDSTYNEYLFKLEKTGYSDLPAVSYKINPVSIKGLITKYLSPLTKNDIFKTIKKSEEQYEILSIKLIKEFFPFIYTPKKGNFIFMKYNSKDIYYFDYVKNKKIKLTENNEETDFDGTYKNLSKYYIISIIPKKLIFTK